MTELEISIGGRFFSIACDNEEQDKVKEAASLINDEADAMQSQLGRLPESKMLLLSALMVADRLVDLESESKALKGKSDGLLHQKNKNMELQKKMSNLEKDYEKLESFVERILIKLETFSNFSEKKTSRMESDEKESYVLETDQPKLF